MLLCYSVTGDERCHINLFNDYTASIYVNGKCEHKHIRPFWVAVRRTYVFTLQEVEKICRTLQSHLMQVWTMTFWLLAPDPDKAEPLPVLSNKLPFFSTDALAQIA